MAADRCTILPIDLKNATAVATPNRTVGDLVAAQKAQNEFYERTPEDGAKYANIIDAMYLHGPDKDPVSRIPVDFIGKLSMADSKTPERQRKMLVVVPKMFEYELLLLELSSISKVSVQSDNGIKKLTVGLGTEVYTLYVYVAENTGEAFRFGVEYVFDTHGRFHTVILLGTAAGYQTQKMALNETVCVDFSVWATKTPTLKDGVIVSYTLNPNLHDIASRRPIAYDRNLDYILSVGHDSIINFSLDHLQFSNCRSIGDMETFHFYRLCNERKIENFRALRVVSDDPNWRMSPEACGELRKLCHFDEGVNFLLDTARSILAPSQSTVTPSIDEIKSYIDHLKKTYRQMNNKLTKTEYQCRVNELTVAEYQRVYLNSLICDINEMNDLKITEILAVVTVEKISNKKKGKQK